MGFPDLVEHTDAGVEGVDHLEAVLDHLCAQQPRTGSYVQDLNNNGTKVRSSGDRLVILVSI